MSAPRSLTPVQESRIAASYGKGTDTATLSRRFGVSGSTIRETVKRQGGTLRPRGGVPGKTRKRNA